MDGTAWFISIVLAVGFVVVFAATFVPGSGRRSTQRLVRSIGIGLPPQLEAEVEARVILRQRAGSIGAAIAVAAAVAFFVLSSAAPSQLTGLLIVGAAFAGIAIGAGVSAATASAATAPGEARVARLRAVSVRDYLAPLELLGARVVAGLAVVTAIAVIALTPFADGDDAANVVVITALGVTAGVSLALFELFSRRIVDRPQPVGTPVELAWDDALRSSTLRDIVTAPLLIGVYTVMYGFIEISDRVGVASDSFVGFAVAAGVFMLVLAALLILAIVSIVSRPQRHVIRRLWPDVDVDGARPDASAGATA